jgi:predicted dinucleotide-binding enzyme
MGAARRTATDLLDVLGYDALETGGLADSWRFEFGNPF